MIRLLIVDSCEEYRKRIKLVLSSQSDFNIIATGKDGYDALTLTETLKPDITLLDINLSYIDGAKVTSLIKRKSPDTSIIILTSIDDEEYVLKTICNGASGYLLKNRNPKPENLAHVIRTVYNGGSLLHPHVATRTFRMISNLARKGYREAKKPDLPLNISRTELQTMSLIGQGLSYQEIAEQMKIREGTVRNRVTVILQKTGLRDRTQIAIFAIHQGLTQCLPAPSQKPGNYSAV
jgi:DNA-binding NarL/FixJ family response regulator